MSLLSSSRGIPGQQFRAPDLRVGGDDGIQFHISESAAGTYHPQDHLQQVRISNLDACFISKRIVYIHSSRCCLCSRTSIT